MPYPYDIISIYRIQIETENAIEILSGDVICLSQEVRIYAGIDWYHMFQVYKLPGGCDKRNTTRFLKLGDNIFLSNSPTFFEGGEKEIQRTMPLSKSASPKKYKNVEVGTIIKNITEDQSLFYISVFPQIPYSQARC